MAFDRKAWDEANREKNRLYSVRHRLRKKGMDLPPETVAEMDAMRVAKKEAAKERDRQRKKQWAAANRELIRARYREKYHSDPEFRASEIAKRAARLPKVSEEKKAAKKLRTQLSREDRLRQKREEAARKRKEVNAARHTEALAKAERIPPRATPRTTPPTFKVKKPGRLCALMGWRGY